jgi:hypothetical protein
MSNNDTAEGRAESIAHAPHVNAVRAAGTGKKRRYFFCP